MFLNSPGEMGTMALVHFNPIVCLKMDIDFDNLNLGEEERWSEHRRPDSLEPSVKDDEFLLVSV
ncbi:hypothetical protein TIFTF001_013769 [Ficus carica]|uniref:Uncharacterized protein n=1 Tax=Ficus carica TaxID=3494 RepID=A0AA87ZYC5_FICCA|nr:hypothetical protein TIFTF001_013769 [Ficus carica]